MLEMFSGAGRLARAFGELGWETVTLDSSERCGADICCTIIDWDYSEMELFDHIHMSPPCTEFSQAKTRGARDIDSATRICLATLIAARALLRPGGTWSMENPASGMWALHKQPFMAEYNLRRHEITYCNYGDPYRKLTSLWSDLPWAPRAPCRGGHRCSPSRRLGHHPRTAQQGPSGANGSRCKTSLLSALPHVLCKELALAAQMHTGIEP